MLTALCCANGYAADPSEAEPQTFKQPRHSRSLPVVDAEEALAAADAEFLDDADAPAESAPVSNSRAISRKAVHISFIDDPEENGGPAVLRWHAPPSPMADENVTPAQATLDESGPYLAAPAVLESADDFQNPFDERMQVLQPEAESDMPMAEAEAEPEPLAPEEESRELELPLEGGTQPSLAEYNNRDCASEIANCNDVRRRVRGRPIRQISLDISPVFSPAPDESAQKTVERSRDFENKRRQWRNNRGELIARGAMIGIENGRVLIRDEKGEVQRIEYRELSDEDLCYFAAWWGIPTECTLGTEDYAGRQFAPSTFTWKASALCHKPLYFEEVQLERYGHTTGPIFQPVISGAHFFLNIATLPYKMGIHPPMECQYALGYYRPGDCAPWLLPPVPLSVRGGLAQAGAVVGGIYILP